MKMSPDPCVIGQGMDWLLLAKRNEEVGPKRDQWATGYPPSKRGKQRQQSEGVSNPVPIYHKGPGVDIASNNQQDVFC